MQGDGARAPAGRARDDEDGEGDFEGLGRRMQQSMPSAAGYRRPLGEQGQPRTPVASVEGCLSATALQRRFIHPHIPVIMRGCARSMEVPKLWTDTYLHRVAGGWTSWRGPGGKGMLNLSSLLE